MDASTPARSFARVSEDDPFNESPLQSATKSFDAELLATLGQSDPAQARRLLESQLQDTERRIQNASRHGEALLSQRQRLNDSLRDIGSSTSGGNVMREMNPNLRQRLVDIEKEASRGAHQKSLNRRRQSSDMLNAAHTFAADAAPSPSKPQPASSKHSRAQTTDLQLAADISSSLLEQVRNLQATLAEKDLTIKKTNEQNLHLSNDAETLRSRLRTLDESEQKYKDECWNLETQLHDLLNDSRDATDREQRLNMALSQARNERSIVEREYEELRASHTQLNSDHEILRKQHDSDIATHRRTVTSIDDERDALQRRVDDLASQNFELARAVAARRMPELKPQEVDDDDEDSLLESEQRTPEQSMPSSPVKQTPRHGALESETLRSSLNHAHRMIQTLKNNIHREKTEKAELRRMLQDARDDLETRKVEGGLSAAGSSRRKPKQQHGEVFKRPSRPEKLGAFKSTTEEWEDDEDTIIKASVEQDSTDADFETADEQQADTDYHTAGGTDDGSETETERERELRSSTKSENRISFLSTASDEDLSSPTRQRHFTPRLRSLRDTSMTPSKDSPMSFISGSSQAYGGGQDLAAELDGLDSSSIGSPGRSVTSNGDESPTILRASTGSRFVRSQSVKPAMVEAGTMTDSLSLAFSGLTQQSTAPITVPLPVVKDSSTIMTPFKSSNSSTTMTPYKSSSSSTTMTPVRYSSLNASTQFTPARQEDSSTSMTPLKSNADSSTTMTPVRYSSLATTMTPVRTSSRSTSTTPIKSAAQTESRATTMTPQPQPTMVDSSASPIVFTPADHQLKIVKGQQEDGVFSEPTLHLAEVQGDGFPYKTPAFIEQAASPAPTLSRSEILDQDSIAPASSSASSARHELSVRHDHTAGDVFVTPTKSHVRRHSRPTSSPNHSQTSSHLMAERPASASSFTDFRPKTTPPRDTTVPPLPADHREVIAAAASRTSSLVNAAPPLMATLRSSQQQHQQQQQERERERDLKVRASSATIVQRPLKQRASSITGRSDISRRSSVSSFASELDQRFNLGTGGDMMANANADPRMITAITQTMIGEFLYKYTRKTGRDELSGKRHRRFFWIHPYTRTLYWSNDDPSAAGRPEHKAKSVSITAVRVVDDNNPLPPGLHPRSIVVMTPGRSIKFTAPTSQRHETWLNALSYLLLRQGEGEVMSSLQRNDTTTSINSDDLSEFNVGQRAIGRSDSRLSRRSGGRTLTAYAQPTLTKRPSSAHASSSVHRSASTVRRAAARQSLPANATLNYTSYSSSRPVEAAEGRHAEGRHAEGRHAEGRHAEGRQEQTQADENGFKKPALPTSKHRHTLSASSNNSAQSASASSSKASRLRSLTSRLLPASLSKRSNRHSLPASSPLDTPSEFPSDPSRATTTTAPDGGKARIKAAASAVELVPSSNSLQVNTGSTTNRKRHSLNALSDRGRPQASHAASRTGSMRAAAGGMENVRACCDGHHDVSVLQHQHQQHLQQSQSRSHSQRRRSLSRAASVISRSSRRL